MTTYNNLLIKSRRWRGRWEAGAHRQYNDEEALTFVELLTAAYFAERSAAGSRRLMAEIELWEMLI
jgi:hypothetical protein